MTKILLIDNKEKRATLVDRIKHRATKITVEAFICAIMFDEMKTDDDFLIIFDGNKFFDAEIKIEYTNINA